MHAAGRVARWAGLLGVLGGAACKGDVSGDGPLPPTSDSGTFTEEDTGTPPEPVTTDLTDGGSQTCLRLFGGNDRVRATEARVPLGASSRTMQAWVRTASLLPQVALSTGLAAPERGFYLGTDEGYLMASDAGLPTIDEGAFVADGDWHHIAISFDGTEATLWFDGRPGARAQMDEVDTADGEVVAGGAPTTGGMPWVGWLDDVRVYQRERTAADFAADVDGDDRGLVLWWDFEVEGEGPGVVVSDRSDNGGDGMTGGGSGTPMFLACR